MPLIENLDFNGSSDIMQYIPTVETVSEPPPTEEKKEEKISGPIEMDFSTPIQDVMPSAPLDDTPGLTGPYVSPTNNRVVAVSPGVVTAESKSVSKNPLGVTDEQFQAIIAGVIAVVAFSKPVQSKLAEMVPKFLGESGDLSTTGMVVSALIAAALFYFATQALKKT
jgi:hypothetical protein